MSVTHKKSLLVTLATKDFLDQAKQVFSSAYWQGGWDGDFLLLAHDVPAADLTWFKSKGILVKSCSNAFFEPIGTFPMVVYDKFKLFTPEFSQWDNIVYLDGDVMVRGSLAPLSNVQGFWAVRIYHFEIRTTLGRRFYDETPANAKLFARLRQRYDLRQLAFNSGIMAFSTNSVSPTAAADLEQITLEYRDINIYSDESTLNLYFSDRWHELPAIYNFCPGYEMFLRKCSVSELKTVVCHPYSLLARENKPWKIESPLHQEWLKNLARADDINILNPQRSVLRLAGKRAWTASNYLKRRHYIYQYYIYVLRRKKIIRAMERVAGAVGPVLKKFWPKLYQRLKTWPIFSDKKPPKD